jgi:predicted phage terminase large subunit-like protein
MILSDNDKAIVRVNIERALYKKSYGEFFNRCVRELESGTDWHIGWYHYYLCDLMQKEAERIHRGEEKTCDVHLCSIPPRSSKSLLFSSVFNSWLWLYYPQQKLLTLSYSDELANQLSYQTKLIFELPWYINLNNSFRLDPSNNSKSRFYNDKQGARYAAGMQASVTGFGGDWILVDDAAKVNEIGELKRQNVINQFKNTIYNRANNARTVSRWVIGQRIHSGDLIGWCLENLNNVKQINLPAKISDTIRPIELIAEYEKRSGYLLPELFDEKVLSEYRTALGSYGYSAQYDMQPVPTVGGYIKYDDIQPIQWQDDFAKLTWNMYIDSAYGKKGGDASAILIAAKWNNSVVVKRSYQLFEEFPELIRSIQRLYSEHCNVLSKVLIEPKASGLSLIQSIKKETRFNVQELEVGRDDKNVRCMAITPITESKRVYIIDGMWNTKFLDEVCNFPLATYDDQTDCLVYAIDHLLNKNVSVNYVNQKNPNARVDNYRRK